MHAPGGLSRMIVLTSLTFVFSLLSVLEPVAAKSALEAYTPTSGECPSGFTLVREVSTIASEQTLSVGEQEYIKNRKVLLPGAWKTYLANVQATNVTLPSYVSDILTGSGGSTLPTFGIATSGGGYRAAIFGAGILNAIDARSEQPSGVSGLLQASTYLAGLSGGSWL
jgi:lysophospholipase